MDPLFHASSRLQRGGCNAKCLRFPSCRKALSHVAKHGMSHTKTDGSRSKRVTSEIPDWGMKVGLRLGVVELLSPPSRLRSFAPGLSHCRSRSYLHREVKAKATSMENEEPRRLGAKQLAHSRSERLVTCLDVRSRKPEVSARTSHSGTQHGHLQLEPLTTAPQ